MLSAADSEHIRSLRLRPDETFVVCDGSGTDYICCLGEHPGGSSAQIISSAASQTEPSVKCTAFIAYAKGERLDYAVQKSVELGVFSIVLFNCERCIVKPGDNTKKIGRLQRIALETAKQCGRGIIPEVSAARDFKSAVDKAAERSDLALLCYEDEKKTKLKTVLEEYFPVGTTESTASVAVITGPEGGFEQWEVQYASSKGLAVVSLGPRILRCETAPVAALSAIMYQTGNM